MLRLAVCDDSPQVLEAVETILEARASSLEWEVFASGDALLRYMQRTGEAFQIYLLDIEMPGRSGIDTAAAIRESDRDAVIVFLTGYREYVFQVFEVLPFRFLQKPVRQAELLAAVDGAAEHLHRAGRLFFYQVGRDRLQCPYGEILYFEGAGRKVVIHTAQGQREYYGKIGEAWETLEKGLFTRTHASYIVNMDHIRAVRATQVELTGGVLVPVSKRHRAGVKQDHLQFIARRNHR